MAQPTKKNTITPKKSVKKKTIKKNDEQTKRLPTQKNIKTKTQRKRKHPEYGTSKLEEKFAKNFLDKLGVKYIYQFKAESIGRYYDFMVLGNEEHPYKKIIIEIQGSYWHADPRLYEEKDLNAIQKKDKKIDEYKKKWCSKNGIPLLYVWELDINKYPTKLLDFLTLYLKDCITNIKKT